MNSANPLVSVVVPVFNGERFIAATLSSALNQSYQNIEVIVVIPSMLSSMLMEFMIPITQRMVRI